MKPDELVVTDLDENGPEEPNLFVPLVPDAQQVVRQTMLFSSNEKLRVSTAQDVLDRAGHTRKQEGKPTTPIVITNSQVAIMSGVAEEVEHALEHKGE